MIAVATKIVSDYGRVLAKALPGVYGLPESSLPHQKETIRYAILCLLERLGYEHIEVRESLEHGYVYLAQFVSDTDAEIVSRGQTRISGQTTEPAMQVINRIKQDMQSALEELQRLRSK